MERLTQEEIKTIIDELKKSGKYKEYQEMLLDDFEEHHVVYKIEADELIAIAHKNNTIPYKLIEFYDWQQMNYLIEEEDGIEEERRLCYVATTRARQKLYISFTERRSMYGKSQSTLNSRFVDEITDKSAIKKTIEKKSYDNKFDSKYSDGSGYSYNYNEFGNYERKSSSANFDFLTANK